MAGFLRKKFDSKQRQVSTRDLLDRQPSSSSSSLLQSNASQTPAVPPLYARFAKSSALTPNDDSSKRNVVSGPMPLKGRPTSPHTNSSSSRANLQSTVYSNQHGAASRSAHSMSSSISSTSMEKPLPAGPNSTSSTPPSPPYNPNRLSVTPTITSSSRDSHLFSPQLDKPLPSPGTLTRNQREEMMHTATASSVATPNSARSLLDPYSQSPLPPPPPSSPSQLQPQQAPSTQRNTSNSSSRTISATTPRTNGTGYSNGRPANGHRYNGNTELESDASDMDADVGAGSRGGDVTANGRSGGKWKGKQKEVIQDPPAPMPVFAMGGRAAPSAFGVGNSADDTRLTRKESTARPTLSSSTLKVPQRSPSLGALSSSAHSTMGSHGHGESRSNPPSPFVHNQHVPPLPPTPQDERSPPSRSTSVKSISDTPRDAPGRRMPLIFAAMGGDDMGQDEEEDLGLQEQEQPFEVQPPQPPTPQVLQKPPPKIQKQSPPPTPRLQKQQPPSRNQQPTPSGTHQPRRGNGQLSSFDTEGGASEGELTLVQRLRQEYEAEVAASPLSPAPGRKQGYDIVPQPQPTRKLSKVSQGAQSAASPPPAIRPLPRPKAQPQPATNGASVPDSHTHQHQTKSRGRSSPTKADRREHHARNNSVIPLDEDPFAKKDGVTLMRSLSKERQGLSVVVPPRNELSPSSSSQNVRENTGPRKGIRPLPAPGRTPPTPVNSPQHASPQPRHLRPTPGRKYTSSVASIFSEQWQSDPDKSGYFPLSLYLSDPHMLSSLISYLSFYEWCMLFGTSKLIRTILGEDRSLREEVLERYLRTVGYVRWERGETEPLSLSLRDLNAYMRGVSTPTHQYARVAEKFTHARAHGFPNGKQPILDAMKALTDATRAYTRVVLRLRAQAEAEHEIRARTNHGQSPINSGLTSFRSPLFTLRRAPLLHVFVPSAEGDWLSDSSVIECELELKRAGVVKLLRLGDVVWDVAVGDEGNIGRLVWDGSYLIDLDYTYTAIGDLPKYLHALSFPPSYFHRVIRTGPTVSNPIVNLDISPWGQQISRNIELLQDQVRTETPQGASHNVVRWVHRSSFIIHPQQAARQSYQSQAQPPRIFIPGTDGLFVDPGWYGTVVVEAEGTNEGLADLQERCGMRAVPVAREGKDDKRVFRILRERSRPGEIWIRTVRAKERLL